MAFGVTDTGFNRKRVEDIREELQEDFKSAFGEDLDVTADSNAGALIDLLTKKFATIWEGLEESYNSRDVNGAQGLSLDRICQMVGVSRAPATPTTVQGVLTGDNGTVIAAGSLVAQDTTNEEFSLNNNVTINTTNTIEASIEVGTVIDSTAYVITINSNNYTINSGAGATAASIIAALKVEVDLGGEPIIFTDNLDGTALIVADDGITIFTISLSTELDFIELSVLGQFIASNTGPTAVPSNSINTIVTPVSGWSTIKNDQAGITGSAIETDEQLRARRSNALLGTGAGTDPAIEANLFNEVDNVTSVRVISNRTNGTVDSRPAKSYEAIVTGGEDQDVADKLWEVQPSGIESYGNTTINVVDSNGDTQIIKFSRPVDRYIWIKYTLELYSEEALSANIEATIKDAVVLFATEEYRAGVDVIRDRLTQPVYESVTGVGNMTIELAVTALPTDTPIFGSANIPISDREIAAVTQSRIQVTIP